MQGYTFILLTLICQTAYVSADIQNEPASFFGLPVQYSFGKIPNNMIAFASLQLYNPISSPITTKSITISCGCVQAGIEPQTLKSKEKGRLNISWNVAGKLGQNEKTVHIMFSGTKQTAVKLILAGDVYFAGKAGTIFEGRCFSCHGAPAKDKTGKELYYSVCSMCHGKNGKGNASTQPFSKAKLSSTPDRKLFDVLYDGDWDKGMPAYGLTKTGPLDASQIASLVWFLKNGF